MVFQITQAVDDPRALTQAVLQITTLLDMFQAELARVLHVNCGDIGQLSCGRQTLETGTLSWDQAQLFVRFYQGLYQQMNGDGVAMRHWLRIENRALEGVPHLLMVDDDRLAELVSYVERDIEGHCFRRLGKTLLQIVDDIGGFVHPGFITLIVGNLQARYLDLATAFK